MARRIALLIALAVPGLSWGQAVPEALKGPERATFEDMKTFRTPVDDKNRDIVKKQAKYVVGQLLDPKRIAADDLARVTQDLIMRDLPWTRDLGYRPKTAPEGQVLFTAEFGKALCDELPPALKHGKPVVRVNAARVLSVVALAGYAPSADLALQVLEDKLVPDENDGVKFYALQTLTNAFGFVPDPVNPQQSAFVPSPPSQPKDYREIERRSIAFLCNYVLKSRDVAGKAQEEIDAIRYVRREAIRALGNVRQSRVIFQEKVLAKPGWVLLKVANRDGIVPEPDLKEQSLAIIGFGRLFPVVKTADRGINVDYASHALNSATYDLISKKVGGAVPDVALAWLNTGAWMEDSQGQFAKNALDMSLTNAGYAKPAFEKVKVDLFVPLAGNQQGNLPNTNAFRDWLIANAPKTTTLYQGDAESVIKPALGVGN